MPETNVYKTLVQVFLPAAVAVLTGGTVPALKGWIPRKITVINTDVVTRTYALYVNGITDQFLVTPAAVSLGAGEMDVYDEIDGLAAAETIAGVASVASKLAIRISGDEVTL